MSTPNITELPDGTQAPATKATKDTKDTDTKATCACHDAHVHGYNENKSKYLARLKRIEGQTRGIHRMVDEDQYCIDILTQVSAVTSALENVALALLEDHIRHCVTGATVEGGDVADEKIEEAMKAIQRMVKS